MSRGTSAAGTDHRLVAGRIAVVGAGGDVSRALHGWLAAAGYETASFPGLESLLDGFPPDLVVLHAEREDGLAQRARWVRARSGVRLAAVLPAAGGRVNAARLLESGADLVLAAPLRGNEVVARVRALLRRAPLRRAGLDATVRYGTLLLDRVGHRLHLGDVVVDLDLRELGLIDALMARPGEVTSRAALRTSLALGEPQLDSLVRRTRERLESVEGWRRLVAERGVGVRLLPEEPAAGAPPQRTACTAAG